MYVLDWEELYYLAKRYYIKYGHLNVSYEYCVLYKDTNICLGAWIKKQRELKKRNKLSEKQITLLEEIGMIWKKNKKNIIMISIGKLDINLQRNFMMRMVI